MRNSFASTTLTIFGLMSAGSTFAADGLAGQVLGGGAPIANATVTLWAASAGAPAQLGKTQTGADGLLALLGPHEGACLLLSVDPIEGSAVQLVRKLRQSGNMIPVIAVGPESAFRTATDIAQFEFTNFLQRPLSAFKLRAAVSRACGSSVTTDVHRGNAVRGPTA